MKTYEGINRLVDRLLTNQWVPVGARAADAAQFYETAVAHSPLLLSFILRFEQRRTTNCILRTALIPRYVKAGGRSF